MTSTFAAPTADGTPFGDDTARFVVVTKDLVFTALVHQAFADVAKREVRGCADIDELLEAAPSLESLTRDNTDVVVFGPDLKRRVVLELATALVDDPSGIGVVIARTPSKKLLRAALQVRVLDVIDPDAPTTTTRRALERALDAVRRARARNAPAVNSSDTSPISASTPCNDTSFETGPEPETEPESVPTEVSVPGSSGYSLLVTEDEVIEPAVPELDEDSTATIEPVEPEPRVVAEPVSTATTAPVSWSYSPSMSEEEILAPAAAADRHNEPESGPSPVHEPVPSWATFKQVAIDSSREDDRTDDPALTQPALDRISITDRAEVRETLYPFVTTDLPHVDDDASDDVAPAGLDEFDGLEEPSDFGPPVGKVISVLSPKGGVGRTTVATNLAIGLAQVAPGQVVIIDLDLLFGDVASALRLAPERTFADTISSDFAFDVMALKVDLTLHPANLFALCAPPTLRDAEVLKPEGVQRVIAGIAQSFRYVIIDTPAGLDEFTIKAIELSTDLIVLLATDVPSVRATWKAIDALERITDPSQRRHFVLNRADARTGLHAAAIEEAVGNRIDVAIPSSGTVPLALNQGTPILEADPRSPVSLAFSQLVNRFVPQESAQAVANGKGGGGFWRKKAAGPSR